MAVLATWPPFETHFHADFVSGHVDLAKTTGASIVFGPEANPSFDFYSAKDREVFSIGDLQITVLHTPGHTMESCCLSFVCQLFSELLHHFVCRSHLSSSKSFKSTPLQILIDIVLSIIGYFCRICMNTYMY